MVPFRQTRQTKICNTINSHQTQKQIFVHYFEEALSHLTTVHVNRVSTLLMISIASARALSHDFIHLF